MGVDEILPGFGVSHYQIPNARIPLGGSFWNLLLMSFLCDFPRLVGGFALMMKNGKLETFLTFELS